MSEDLDLNITDDYNDYIYKLLKARRPKKDLVSYLWKIETENMCL